MTDTKIAPVVSRPIETRIPEKAEKPELKWYQRVPQPGLTIRRNPKQRTWSLWKRSLR